MFIIAACPESQKLSRLSRCMSENQKPCSVVVILLHRRGVAAGDRLGLIEPKIDSNIDPNIEVRQAEYIAAVADALESA